MKRGLAAVGVAVGLSCIAYALWSSKTDEELIRERLDELEAAIVVEGESGNLAVEALQTKGTFSNLFEPEVRAHIPELGSTRQGRDELAGVATRSRRYFKRLDVEFNDIHVQIDGTQRNARVDTRAELTAVQRAEPGLRREVRQVQFGFFKHEDHGWRINAVDVGDLPDE